MYRLFWIIPSVAIVLSATPSTSLAQKGGGGTVSASQLRAADQAAADRQGEKDKWKTPQQIEEEQRKREELLQQDEALAVKSKNHQSIVWMFDKPIKGRMLKISPYRVWVETSEKEVVAKSWRCLPTAQRDMVWREAMKSLKNDKTITWPDQDKARPIL